ncbi:MAG: hypothetical protein GY953_40995, partial [bacterium]|nr:hypothetical protein [bacterium]
MEHLPTNQRSVQALIIMAPGVINSSGGDEINVNGLRSNTSYYTVDGVSANMGVSSRGGFLGARGGRGGRGTAGTGVSAGENNTANMISLDAMQEVQIQTSAFAPEFGRSPGAQISITSRSGGSDYHGSIYGYMRNDRFNANDWFANSNALPRGRMRHRQFGAVIGGPIVPNSTYFFGSYEGLRSTTPETAVAAVPDLDTRAAARADLKPYVNAFPLPNGPALEDGAAQFAALYTNRNHNDSASLRIDQRLGSNFSMFARYSYFGADRDLRGRVSPNVLTSSDSKSHAFTTSLLWLPDPLTTNDLRINVT